MSAGGESGTGDETGGTGGDTGGSGGSSGKGGSAGSGTGGSGASGGAGGSATGGAGGGDTGGAGGTTGGAGGSSGTHPLTANNTLVACKTSSAYHLPNASPEDFCAFYEKYCMYDPTGMMQNKGRDPTVANSGSTSSWWYKSYDDCITRYTMASAGAKSCRAGQLCQNKAGGCTHATGHFADCP